MITCPSCGNPNATGNSHCIRCGAQLSSTPGSQPYFQPAPPPQQQQPWNQPPPYGQQQYNPGYNPYQPGQQQGTPQDMGFLLLAIFPVVESLMWWMMRSMFGSSVFGIFMLLLSTASWVVMIMYTRNMKYKIIIIVLAAIMLGLRVWNQFSGGYYY